MNNKCLEQGVDVNSLNGRVASAIPRLVPHPSNFRRTLRAVTLWAQQRGLTDHARLCRRGGVGAADGAFPPTDRQTDTPYKRPPPGLGTRRLCVFPHAAL